MSLKEAYYFAHQSGWTTPQPQRPIYLLDAHGADEETFKQIHADARAEAEAALEQALREPKPTPADVEKHTYAASKVDAVYPGDYTGLPKT